MIKNLLLLTALLAPSLCMAVPEIKGSPQELRGILHPTDKIVTIRGNANETAYSDRAIISLLITTIEEQLSDAIAENQSLRKKLRQSLITAGIDRHKIKNSKFSSSPQYGWLGKKPNSYKVVNRMAIAIEEEGQLHSIAQFSDQNEEITIMNTTFEHSEEQQYNKKVQSHALKKIMKQKGDYEQILGVKLTPIGIRNNDTRYRATDGAMTIEEVVVTASRRKNEEEFYSFETESSFDEILYEAELSVDFRITPEPKPDPLQ